MIGARRTGSFSRKLTGRAKQFSPKQLAHVCLRAAGCTRADSRPQNRVGWRPDLMLWEMFVGKNKRRRMLRSPSLCVERNGENCTCLLWANALAGAAFRLSPFSSPVSTPTDERCRHRGAKRLPNGRQPDTRLMIDCWMGEHSVRALRCAPGAAGEQPECALHSCNGPPVHTCLAPLEACATSGHASKNTQSPSHLGLPLAVRLLGASSKWVRNRPLRREFVCFRMGAPTRSRAASSSRSARRGQIAPFVRLRGQWLRSRQQSAQQDRSAIRVGLRREAAMIIKKTIGCRGAGGETGACGGRPSCAELCSRRRRRPELPSCAPAASCLRLCSARAATDAPSQAAFTAGAGEILVRAACAAVQMKDDHSRPSLAPL